VMLPARNEKRANSGLRTRPHKELVNVDTFVDKFFDGDRKAVEAATSALHSINASYHEEYATPSREQSMKYFVPMSPNTDKYFLFGSPTSPNLRASQTPMFLDNDVDFELHT